MKFFCVAILLLVSLTVCILFTAFRVEGVLSEMILALEQRELAAFRVMIQRHDLLLRLAIPQNELSEIEERLSALERAASLSDTLHTEIELARLLSVIRRARSTVAPSLSDLL